MQFKQWLIRKLGGYATIQEAIQAAPGDSLNAMVADLYCVVTEKDIFREKNGILTYKGHDMTEAEVMSICSEAEYLSKTLLWKYLQEEIRYHATKKMYFDSQTVNDMTWGKLLLFLGDILKTRVNTLSKKKNTL